MKQAKGNSSRKPSSDIHHAKDKFAREMFSHTELMIPFLEKFFPELNPSGDWRTLKQEPGSFVSEELASKYSDVLYSFKRGGDQTLVYILIEPKSQQEFWTVLYLLQLMIQIWMKWLKGEGKGKKHLPFIVPILLHQSTGEWTAPLRFQDFFQDDPMMQKHVPAFASELVELSKVQTETILNWFLQAVVTLMKAPTEGNPLEWLEGNLKVLSGEIYKRFGGGMVIFILNYLAQSEGKINISTIQEIATKITDRKAKRNVMTWAESLREEAREEGRLIGQITTWRDFLGLRPLPERKFKSMSIVQMQAMAKLLKTEAGKRTR